MRRIIERYETQSQRLLEILLGVTAWLLILFPFWGAFFMPKMVAYFTIIFLVYWLYISFGGAFMGIRGYLKIRKSEKINWYKKYLKDRNKASLVWRKIKHLIVIPNYNESVEKISLTLKHLADQKNIEKKQLLVVLAMEERASDSHQRAEILAKKFKNKFGRLLATFHPDGIIGEVKGKAANEAWAAKEAKKILVDQEGYSIEKITLTSCDADACFHPQYFSALTYFFALDKNRYLRFWQSPIAWYNNFWRVPAFIRIVGTIGNIIEVARLQHPDNLYFNYSTYSTSLKMVNKVGYWDTDVISEDWHLFLQCFFNNRGRVEVEPIFLPTSIDAPEAKTYFGSLKNRYEQCKRHAWGATDIPYAIKQSILHPEIPFWTRFFRIFKIAETHLIWSTNWFILTLGAWAPALINPAFRQTALGYNLPKISRLILTFCLLSLFILVKLDYSLQPKRAKKISFWQSIINYGQWILMPIATLFMNTLPAVDSQTRLMLGKRLEYRVTEKV